MNTSILLHDRIRQTASKIEGFRQTQAGWHYGDGILPKPGIVDKALVLNNTALYANSRKTNAFLGISGEIRVTIYHEPIYLELTIEPDETITFVAEQNGSVTAYEEKLSLHEAQKRIRTWGMLWDSFVSFTKTTMTQTLGVSRVSPSDLLVTEVEYLSSKKNVFCKETLPSVSTSNDITKALQALPPFSGKYPNYFLSAVS
jgi:hypothetical protein